MLEFGILRHRNSGRIIVAQSHYGSTLLLLMMVVEWLLLTMFTKTHLAQSLGHLNVVPTDQQRVIGSPAPAAIRKMNERHRKKKLVSIVKQWITKFSVRKIFPKIYLYKIAYFRHIPVLGSFRQSPSQLVTMTTTMKMMMICSPYKETLCLMLER